MQVERNYLQRANGWSCSAASNSDYLADLTIVVYEIHRLGDTFCGDSTQRSRTSTVKGCDLTPPIRTQISKQGHSNLIASNRRPLTQISRKSPQSFSRRTWFVRFLKVEEMCIEIISTHPRIL